MKGEGYLGYTRKPDGKVLQNQQRDPRNLKPRCNHSVVKKKKTEKTYLCGMIDDDTRKAAFQYMWEELKWWDAHQKYIKGLVTTRTRLRRRKTVSTTPNNNRGAKQEGNDCYIPLKNGEKVRVCRTMFINTFSIGRDCFQRWCRMSSNSNDTVSVLEVTQIRKKI